MNAQLKPVPARQSYVHPEWLGVDRESWTHVNLDTLMDNYLAGAKWDASQPLDPVAHFAGWCLQEWLDACDERNELKREWATLPRDRRRS